MTDAEIKSLAEAMVSDVPQYVPYLANRWVAKAYLALLAKEAARERSMTDHAHAKALAELWTNKPIIGSVTATVVTLADAYLDLLARIDREAIPADSTRHIAHPTEPASGTSR